MGLTIHYRLAFHGSSAAAQSAVRALHERAAALGFASLDPLAAIRDPAVLASDSPGGFWILDPEETDDRGRLQKLREFHGFTITPGPGCESAEFGLVRYGGRAAAVRAADWSFYAFCKTQYAGAPQAGGFDNFFRCHAGLIRLLDHARRKLGFQVRVRDEAGYWRNRDRDRLRAELQSWNELIAAFAGELKDALPGQITGPILNYPQFERLEARGEQALRAIRRREKG